MWVLSKSVDKWQNVPMKQFQEPKNEWPLSSWRCFQIECKLFLFLSTMNPTYQQFISPNKRKCVATQHEKISSTLSPERSVTNDQYRATKNILGVIVKVKYRNKVEIETHKQFHNQNQDDDSQRYQPSCQGLKIFTGKSQ